MVKLESEVRDWVDQTSLFEYQRLSLEVEVGKRRQSLASPERVEQGVVYRISRPLTRVSDHRQRAGAWEILTECEV